MLHILATGAGGQVGRALLDAFSGCEVTAADRHDLDITDEVGVRTAVRDLRPDVVVNPDRIHPIATAELDPPRRAARPANSRLARDAAEATGVALPGLATDAIARMVAQLVAA